MGSTIYIGTIIDITERKQAEEKLRNNEIFINSILNSLSAHIAVLDANGTIIAVNDAWRKFGDENGLATDYHFGLNKSYFEPCKKSFPESSSEDAINAQDGIMAILAGTRDNFELEYACHSPTDQRWFSMRVTALTGSKQGVVVSHENITQRKRMEETLKASEIRFRTIIDVSPVPMALNDDHQNIVFLNRAFIQTFGYDLTDIPTLADWWRKAYPDENYRQWVGMTWQTTLRKCEQENVSFLPLELTIHCKNGIQKSVLVSASRISQAFSDLHLVVLYDVTERVQTEKELQKAKEAAVQSAFLGNQALELAQAGHWSIDFREGGDYYISSERTVAIFGDPPRDDFRYHIMNDWYVNIEAIDTAAADATLTNYLAAVDGLVPEYNMIHPYKRPCDGKIIWVHVMGHVIRDKQGKPTNVYGVVMDITERKQSEAELRIAAIAFEAQEGMVVTDANECIIRVNQAFTKITGYTAEESIGKTPKLLHSGRHDAVFYALMWESINTTGAWEGEIWNQRKNGEVYPEYLTITAVKDSDHSVTHYVAIFNDITLNRAKTDEIERLAFYDPLTKLPNRRLLQDRLEHALAASCRNGLSGGLLFIDMDNFKNLNDTLGHEMGDLLLIQVAERLLCCVRENDTVARLGGDEFIVLFEGLKNEMSEAATQVETVGKKILFNLGQPYQLNSSQYLSTPSIGAVLFNGNAQSTDDLLKQADIAMYQAKASGRNALRFFNQQMQAIIMARETMKKELYLAVAENQLILYYQPQVYQNRQITGAEALIRCKHPERGFILPAAFIPLAEESDLIFTIGHWVLETACFQLKNWASHEHTQYFQLAVNVSARQFHHPDFVAQVIHLINSVGINPTRLKLELTESMAIDSIEDTIKKMNALRKVGVQFSMDDFGTGYSSLSNLKKLPIEQLKIDQSFVRDISTDPDDAVIVQTIIAMAKNMSLEIIAEGVETEAQRLFLEQHGCQHFQGYLFSKPVPIEQFEAFIR